MSETKSAFVRGAASLPNPSVDRKHRRTILERRVRNIERRKAKGKMLKRSLDKKLADYKNELGGRS